MSERNHSAYDSTEGLPARRRVLPLILGTGVAVLAAVVGLQVYNADEAASQTRPGADTGVATAQIATTKGTGERLAVVNKESITYDEVARECYERHGKEVLENIINRRLIEQECARLGITVTNGDVQQEVVKIAKRFNIAPDAWYTLLKNERNITPQQYHRDVIFPMIALRKIAGENIEVTNQDMKEIFERNYGERVEARMILVEGNIRQANETWEMCKANPEDFGRVARERSADATTRALGGVIPPIARHGGNHPQVEEEAFKLRVNEISSLIDVGDGRYVILKCEGRTKPIVTDIRDVWDELQPMLVEEKTQEAVAKVFESIRKKAEVINYVTNSTTLGAASVPSSGIQQTSGVRPATATP
ncbi:MAG: SurA N-terminal domain-containing protein [Planctomycetaceae bacterium]